LTKPCAIWRLSSTTSAMSRSLFRHLVVALRNIVVEIFPRLLLRVELDVEPLPLRIQSWEHHYLQDGRAVIAALTSSGVLRAAGFHGRRWRWSSGGPFLLIVAPLWWRAGHRRKTRRHRLVSRHHRAGDRAPPPPWPPRLCPAGPPATARRRGRGEGAGARRQRSPPCRPRVRRHGDWADSIGFSLGSLRLFTHSLFLRVDAILRGSLLRM
jgi:hypothetical protein